MTQNTYTPRATGCIWFKSRSPRARSARGLSDLNLIHPVALWVITITYNTLYKSHNLIVWLLIPGMYTVGQARKLVAMRHDFIDQTVDEESNGGRGIRLETS